MYLFIRDKEKIQKEVGIKRERDRLQQPCFTTCRWGAGT